MTKAELRAEYKQKRALLTPEAVSALSQQITDQFFGDEATQQALAKPAAVLHTFLPIRRQHEVDTWPIIRGVWTNFPHVRVLSSVANPTSKTLTSFELRPDTILVENRWGIPEPVASPDLVLPSPTLVLVPLLAFDVRGHRVGYGGGYYDRFLARTGSDCLKIGLSFFEPVERIDDAGVTDVLLDGYSLPGGTYLFT